LTLDGGLDGLNGEPGLGDGDLAGERGGGVLNGDLGIAEGYFDDGDFDGDDPDDGHGDLLGDGVEGLRIEGMTDIDGLFIDGDFEPERIRDTPDREATPDIADGTTPLRGTDGDR